jgi:hypothetical protein
VNEDVESKFEKNKLKKYLGWNLGVIRTYQQGGRSMDSPRAALTIKGSVQEEFILEQR